MTTKHPPVLEFFFDVVSPYSYLAATQMRTLAQFSGTDVQWKPFLLGGVFKAVANDSALRVPAKAKYMNDDLHRWAKEYGVEFKFPSTFPVVTVKAQRALVAASRLGGDAVERFALGLFRAYWVEDRNPSDEAVVRAVAEQAGLDADAILAACDDPAVKDGLRTNTEEAVRRGAFGAPTFFLGDKMYWGNDRLPFIEAELGAAAR